MARYLIATIPILGHCVPMFPIAQALISQGHEVWWYTGAFFETKITEIAARFVPMKLGFDYSVIENVSTEIVTQRSQLKGLAQLKFDLENFFIKSAINYTKDILTILEEFPADVMVSDSFFIATAWVHELKDIPWAQLGISALTLPSRDTAPFGLGLQPNASLIGRLRNNALYGLLQNVVFRSLYACVNNARAQISLGPTPNLLFDVISPYLYMAATVPGFEYSRSDLPPQVHFIGPMLPKPTTSQFELPSWWSDLEEAQTVIHVTQGTVATDPKNLIIPTLKALEDEPVLVIATTGKESMVDLGDFSPPKNAIVEPFIPYQFLLPHVDAMVTNAGYNGVQMALAHGIPLVAAGKSEDKPEICARISWSGTGINLKTQKPSPRKVKEAIYKILSVPTYRQNAKQVKFDISKHDSAEIACALLNELATQRKPVYS